MIGIVYGALVSLVQPDLKKLVAYSSVSHLGFVMLGIASFTTTAVTGAVYQMLNHGISTGALFLMVGMLYDRRHTRRIAELRRAQGRDALVLGVLPARLPSRRSRCPGFNGFVGEFLILMGSWKATLTGAWGAPLTVVASTGRRPGRGLHAVDGAARALRRGDRPAQPGSARPLGARGRACSCRSSCWRSFMGMASPLFTRLIEPTVDALVRSVRAQRCGQAAPVVAVDAKAAPETAR